LRTWIIELRTSKQDYSVGLARAHPPRIEKGAKVVEDIPRTYARDLWSSYSSPPQPFRFGDSQKYDELREEWDTGERVSVCQKGNWEDDYEKLHRGMMAGTIEPKLLTYNCDTAGQKCGGLADRSVICLFRSLAGRTTESIKH
jgi:hypothetical protein